MEPKQVTIEKMEAMLGQLSAKIEELAAKASDHQRTDDLKVWRAEAQARLDGFKAVEVEKWEGIEAKLALAWSDLGRAVEELGRKPGKSRR